MLADGPCVLLDFWDKDLTSGDDWLGEAVLQLPRGPGGEEQELTLLSDPKKNKHMATGAAKLKVEWVPKKPSQFQWEWASDAADAAASQ